MADDVRWFVGVDWASETHQVAVLDAHGTVAGGPTGRKMGLPTHFTLDHWWGVPPNHEAVPALWSAQAPSRDYPMSTHAPTPCRSLSMARDTALHSRSRPC